MSIPLRSSPNGLNERDIKYSNNSSSALVTYVKDCAAATSYGMNRPDNKKIPERPGVYFFRDKSGRILYIGKAANLRNRLKSYFDSRPKDPRISRMLELAFKTTWQETDSDIEALILESQLIKKNKPLFNVMLRDDKQYFYVGITKESFPKIFLTHQPKAIHKRPVALSIGPFTDGAAIKTTLRLLRRVFPYCTCKQQHNNYCLNYHINKCLGFCCLKNNHEHSQRTAENISKYKKNIRSITDVLSGRKNILVARLEREMNSLGKNEKFEKAIELRDKIEKLKKIFENAQIIQKAKSADSGDVALSKLAKLLKLANLPRRIEGYDISNIQGKFATGSMIVFTDGQADKNQYRKFKIRILDQPDDTAMLREILTRRFNHPEWPYPDLIIIDGGKGQLNTARSAISKQIPTIALTKNESHQGDHIYLSTKKMAIALKSLPEVVRNLILRVDSEAHRFAINYYRKLHRKF